VELESVLVPVVECVNHQAVNSFTEVSVLKGTAGQALAVFEQLATVTRQNCAKQAEAILTLPEWYGLRPGTGRPCFVIVYKQWDGARWGQSTYSTTVFFPRTELITGFAGVTIQPKVQGKKFAHLKLEDGSIIKTTSNTTQNAIDYLLYLITLVKPEVLPDDYANKIIDGTDNRVAELSMLPRKLDYYAHGASDNVRPTLSKYFEAI
jgi:hypothetical protein